MADTELKNIVDNMCNAIDAIGGIAGLTEDLGTIARVEMGLFMMYLSASDGEVSWEEAELISGACGLNLTVEGLAEFIDENRLYSEAFEQQVPVSLKILVAADNVLHEEGESISGSLELIECYRALGIGLINADEEVDPNEERDMDTYLKMMTDYRDANYRGTVGK